MDANIPGTKLKIGIDTLLCKFTSNKQCSDVYKIKFLKTKFLEPSTESTNNY